MGMKNFGLESVETYLQKGIYYVPDYQREYSWKSDAEVDDFWRDLEDVVEDNRESHFFGQVVIHEDKDKKKYIIDGQQRTATSVIVLAVLRDWFNKIYQEHQISAAENKYEDIRIKLIGRWTEDENELRLTLGKVDEDYFRKLIQIGDKDNSVLPIKDSHKRIHDTYNFLYNKIKEKADKESESIEIYNMLKIYYEKFTQGFQLMYVETDEINEAFIIFETLNARGCDLETSDLLKNHLFRISGKKLEETKRVWIQTLDNLDGIDITKFLRHYWNSMEKFSREKDLYKNLREKINTPKKCEEFVENLLKMSDVYKCLCDPSEEFYFLDKEIAQLLQNLKIVNASSFYPVILALVNNNFKEAEVRSVIKAIENLVFRNCVVAGRTANKYEVVFSRLAYDISEKKKTTIEEIVRELHRNTLDDIEFKNAFLYLEIKISPVAKYILREINDFTNCEIQAIKDNSKLHLEHIMPKTKGKWSISEESHEKYLNRLGNLTLLADEYNRSIGNKLFDKKQATYIKSKLNITAGLCNYKKWDEESINDRQSKLYDVAKKRWQII